MANVIDAWQWVSQCSLLTLNKKINLNYLTVLFISIQAFEGFRLVLLQIINLGSSADYWEQQIQRFFALCIHYYINIYINISRGFARGLPIDAGLRNVLWLIKKTQTDFPTNISISCFACQSRDAATNTSRETGRLFFQAWLRRVPWPLNPTTLQSAFLLIVWFHLFLKAFDGQSMCPNL